MAIWKFLIIINIFFKSTIYDDCCRHAALKIN